MSSSHIPPTELAGLVRSRFAGLGLRSSVPRSAVEVRPVLNWGGFVNSSFSILEDGRPVAHVKLADNEGSHAQLRQWATLGSGLHAWYRAPRVLGWMDLPGTAYEGLVLEPLRGTTPETLEETHRAQAVHVVRALHADFGLAEMLAEGHPGSTTCADSYLNTYHDRFVEDLAAIVATPPPFVSPESLSWMTAEVGALHAAVLESSAFQEAATTAVHGDLWLNNIVVEPGEFVRIVDWDDLDLGDPMLDWTMLYGPTAGDLSPARDDDIARLELGVPEVERMNLYGRAALLDWVIDPIADWIEAERDPVHRDEVRLAKEAVSRAARERYRSMYK